MYDLADTVTGAATFEGAAAGKYGLRDQVSDTAVGGHWDGPMPH